MLSINHGSDRIHTHSAMKGVINQRDHACMSLNIRTKPITKKEKKRKKERVYLSRKKEIGQRK